MSPGPNILAVIGTSMGVGRWQGVFLALGVGAGTVQMTNPKAALATLAIVSIGVHTNAPAWVGISIAVGATALSVAAHVIYAITFSTKPMVVIYTKARRFIEAGIGTFFCAMGLRLLVDRD